MKVPTNLSRSMYKPLPPSGPQWYWQTHLSNTTVVMFLYHLHWSRCIAADSFLSSRSFFAILILILLVLNITKFVEFQCFFLYTTVHFYPLLVANMVVCFSSHSYYLSGTALTSLCWSRQKPERESNSSPSLAAATPIGVH